MPLRAHICLKALSESIGWCRCPFGARAIYCPKGPRRGNEAPALWGPLYMPKGAALPFGARLPSLPACSCLFGAPSGIYCDSCPKGANTLWDAKDKKVVAPPGQSSLCPPKGERESHCPKGALWHILGPRRAYIGLFCLMRRAHTAPLGAGKSLPLWGPLRGNI